jgi:hypothetical protein
VQQNVSKRYINASELPGGQMSDYDYIRLISRGIMAGGKEWRVTSIRAPSLALHTFASGHFQPQPLRNLKTHLVKTIAILAFALVCSTAQAGLIGDSITMKLLYPDPTTAFDTQDVLVVAGPADTHAMGTQDDLVDVNPEIDTLFLTFKRDSDMVGSFVGFSVTGIDDTLTGVTVSTNSIEFLPYQWNWDGNALSWDAHSVTVNWSGLHVRGGVFQHHSSHRPHAADRS